MHASKKEENKGLLLSITKISVQMLEENLIQTLVAIFEMVTTFSCAKQHCAPYNSATEAPCWGSLALCAAPSLPQGAHGLFLHSSSPTQQRIVKEGQKKWAAPMELSPLQHDICIDFKCSFHVQNIDCSPQKALMLLI